MTEFTFVHAADLHLDAPFRGLRAWRPEGQRTAGAKDLARLLREATFIVLDRLVDLCIRAEADFLLLAGDVYNSAESSLRARLALRDAFARLEAEGLEVFLAHGNHDPLRDESPVIPWPDNVRVFGSRVSVCTAHRKGKDHASEPALALVHGISHTGPREGRNLAGMFRRRALTLPEPDIYQIGLLHCALAGLSGGHESYAPCTFRDLVEAEMDYWALGHVHAPRLFDRLGRALAGPSGRACAAYPGSAQGLHINETGMHGCLLAKVDAQGGTGVEGIPLAPLRWEQLVVDPGEDTADIPSLERLLLERLEALAPGREQSGREAPAPAGEEAVSSPALGFPPEAVLVRLIITGRTALNHELREPGAMDALSEHLEAELSGSAVWIRDSIAATRPLLDMRAAASRPDLAGEVLRAGIALRDDPAALVEAADRVLAPLFQRVRLRKVVAGPDAAELAALVEEASFVCLDLLGADAWEEDEAAAGKAGGFPAAAKSADQRPGGRISLTAALPGRGEEGG